MAKKIKKASESEEAVEVGKIVPKSRSTAQVGKPRKISKKQMKIASCFGGGASFGGLGGGMGGGMGGAAFGTTMGSGGNFYSPELSTDFLELPQSLDEQRNFYRFFYDNDPFVGQAVDTHVEIPMSKVRLGMPRVRDPKNRPLAEAALAFCTDWARRIDLLQKLIYIAHDYHLLGEAFVYVSDNNPPLPKTITHEFFKKETEEKSEELKPEYFSNHVIKEEVEETEEEGEWVLRDDWQKRLARWLTKNYKGWTSVRTLPPEQIKIETFPFTDERLIELVFDSKSKKIVEDASGGDTRVKKIRDSMPREFVQAIESGEGSLPLNTDPEEGSFCYYMPNKKSEYESRGKSILQRCLRVLVFRDKIRQAQTSIASRNMTPMRLVWAEDADEADIEALRAQIDLALQDPDYSIITNYQVNWEEMGADTRMLDATSEYDMTDRQLYAGLGTTESLLSGESSYSGDRINLEVVNARYMLFRERMQDLTEKYFFEPMCKKMGFVEEIENEFGDIEEYVLYPSLSFTRLPLRDTSDTFDTLFNLYSKGSLDIDVILEMYNIDPVATKEKLKRDLFTVNDPTFNDIVRSIGNDVATKIGENTKIAEIVAAELGLEYTPPDEGDDRF